MGVLLTEKDGAPTPDSPCCKCSAFDGYPCATNGKSDAQVIVVDPALQAHPTLTLLTRAYVERLTTDPSGRTVTGVEVIRDDEPLTFTADIVVAACGALSSALLMLRSANDRHPNGLANGSDRLAATTCGTTTPPCWRCPRSPTRPSSRRRWA